MPGKPAVAPAAPSRAAVPTRATPPACEPARRFRQHGRSAHYPRAKAAAPTPAVESKSAATSTDERALGAGISGELATEVSKGTVNLPCFPDVVMRIRKALAEPEVESDRDRQDRRDRAAAGGAAAASRQFRSLQSCGQTSDRPARRDYALGSSTRAKCGDVVRRQTIASGACAALDLQAAECFVGAEHFRRRDLSGRGAAHAGESRGSISDRLAARHRPALHHGSIGRQIGHPVPESDASST